MSLEREEKNTLDQPAETNNDCQKKSKILYTRDFLLSLSELDVCNKLPTGFDQSLLSEFEDALQDRQRISGSLSSHGLRRNEYGSSPPTRGELGSYSRGIHRWDSRSSGRSDRDSDSQSDWDSDSGRRYGNQSRRGWQVPEHDGLLGSGSFPRPAGYTAGSSAPKPRTNDHYQLNKSNEPYHPPRSYKAAPHSRRETNDSYNDETFGSSECTSEDRAEEERKRRASFELFRKQQQKAFQEKQKMNTERRKDEFDLIELLEDSKDQKHLLSRSKESDEPAMPLALNNDSERSSVPAQTHASRPLVPPGFTSTVLERNFGTKTSINSQASKVGGSELEGNLSQAKGDHLLNGSSDDLLENQSKQFTEQMALNEQQHESISIHVSPNNKIENTLNPSSVLDASGKIVGIGSRKYMNSTLSETFEASENSEVIELDANKSPAIKVANESNQDQDQSTSILDKIFGSALTPNGGGSSAFTEHQNSKADDAVQSSKFARWFFEEEKKQIDDLSSGKPNDLLSLIQGSEKGGSLLSDVGANKCVMPNAPLINSEVVDRHVASNLTSTRIENFDQLSNVNTVTTPAPVPSVLTCEDLEKSMLSESSENDPTLPSAAQGWNVSDAKMEPQKTNIDDHASQHLLSLLQKGIGINDMLSSANLDVRSSDKVQDIEVASTDIIPPDSREANADSAPSSGKALTLEALFGSAFMKELQSIGAPASLQIGSAGSARNDVLESNGVPLPVTDDSLPSSVQMAPNILPFAQREHVKSDRIEEHFLGFDDRRTAIGSSQLQAALGSKLAGPDGSADIRLPEEDSLISVSDPLNLHNFVPVRDSAKAELLSSPETQVDIAEKLAALNSAFRDERPVVGGQEGSPFLRGPYDMREPDIPFHKSNAQPSSPQLHHTQLNHGGRMFHPLDSHLANVSSQMKFMGPEGIIHHDPPPNHQFPANMLRPPFHHHSSGLTGFDLSVHHPMLQQMHMQGNFPPPHLQQGFPGGAPMPPHSNNQVTGFMQEMNPMQGFAFGLQQPNFAGFGMPPGPDVGGGNNHPEALQRLIEMELRSNPKQIHPFGGAAGHSQGMFGHELDMGFGYR